ncbi:hypothetical protein JCM9279_001788 [Rhodotorula babjevae]
MPCPHSLLTKDRALSLPLTTAGATLLASPLLKGPSYHAPYGIPAALPTGLDKVALARHLGLNTGAAPPTLLSRVTELLAPMGGTVHAELATPEVATLAIAASWRAAVTIVLPPGWVNVPADDGSLPTPQLLTETRLAAGAGSTLPAAAAAAVARLAHDGLFAKIANAAVHHPTVEGSLSWGVRLPLLINMLSLQTEENIGIIDADRTRPFLRVTAASYLPSGVRGIELVLAGAIDMRAHLRATRELKPHRAYAQTLHAAREHLSGLLALDSGPTLVTLYAKLHNAMPTSITNDVAQRAIAADVAAVTVINGCASALRSIRNELVNNNSRRAANANSLVAQNTAWCEYEAAARAIAEWEATHNTTVNVFVNLPIEQRPDGVPPPPSLPAAVDAPIRPTLLELQHDYPPGLFASDDIVLSATSAETYSTLRRWVKHLLAWCEKASAAAPPGRSIADMLRVIDAHCSLVPHAVRTRAKDPFGTDPSQWSDKVRAFLKPGGYKPSWVVVPLQQATAEAYEFATDSLLQRSGVLCAAHRRNNIVSRAQLQVLQTNRSNAETAQKRLLERYLADHPGALGFIPSPSPAADKAYGVHNGREHHRGSFKHRGNNRDSRPKPYNKR